MIHIEVQQGAITEKYSCKGNEEEYKRQVQIVKGINMNNGDSFLDIDNGNFVTVIPSKVIKESTVTVSFEG